LAVKFGTANLEKIERYGQAVFGVKLDPRQAEKKNWKIKGKRGGMITSGILGGITGNPADLVIIDDPLKTHAEADSQAHRDKVWNEWETSIQTRLAPNGVCIVIATRWHEDDLIGRLLKQQREKEAAGEPCVKWTLVNLPAVAEENDPLGRAVGDPLWPEKGYTKRWYEIRKGGMSLRNWLALYQQRPTAIQGNIILRDWWKYYSALPSRFDEVIQSWDMNFKNKNQKKDGKPDFVVGTVWGRVKGDFYLIDLVRFQGGFVAAKKAVVNLSAKYSQAPLITRRKYIEDAANGPAIEDELKHDIPGIILWNTKGESKVTRLEAVAGYAQSGNIYLPDPVKTNKPWVNDFVEEIASFPNGANDDQVDSFTQAILNLSKRGGGLVGSLTARS
jgi:predicted phage terminase large subunit-like protein